MRQRIAALAVAGVCASAAGCSTAINGSPLPAAKPATSPVPPVGAAQLDGLLLGVREINAAMGATGMVVRGSIRTMWDWSADVPDKNCLAIDGPAQDAVYSGSGWTAMRGQRLDDSASDSKVYDHYAVQAVILFPSALNAGSFSDSSSQNWRACSQRQYGPPEDRRTVTRISTDNGTLSTSVLQEDHDGFSCERALTVRNNVVVDVMTCSYHPADAAAVDIAHQIAGKAANH